MADGGWQMAKTKAIRHLPSAIRRSQMKWAKRPNGAWPALRIAHWQVVNGSDFVWW